MFEPHSHVPYGKEGSGNYTQNSPVPLAAITKATPLILSALKKITNVKKNLYTICDYGTADGGNTIQVIRECVGHLKAINPGAEIQVWYEDQPCNDFKSLFYRLHGFIQDPPTYLKDFQGVYVAAIGTQFYEQCVPSNSVDLAICGTAVHWLSKRPSILKNALWHLVSDNKEEVNAFKEQAAKDWETFLLHRAAELVPGGQLVIITMVVDEHGHYAGTTSQSESLMLTVGSIYKSMAAEGIITQNEFENTGLINYFRTAEEIASPLENKDSPVWKSGLRMSSLVTQTIPCCLHQEWVKCGRPDDLQARQNHAAKYVNAMRVWSNHSIFAGLSQDRPEEEKRKIVDEFYRRMQDIVCSHPERFTFTAPYVFLHVMKLP